MYEATPEQIADLEAVLGSPASEQHLAALAVANRIDKAAYPIHVAFALLAAQTVNLSVEPAPTPETAPAPAPEPVAPEPEVPAEPEVTVEPEPEPEAPVEPAPAEPIDIDSL